MTAARFNCPDYAGIMTTALCLRKNPIYLFIYYLVEAIFKQDVGQYETAWQPGPIAVGQRAKLLVLDSWSSVVVWLWPPFLLPM